MLRLISRCLQRNSKIPPNFRFPAQVSGLSSKNPLKQRQSMEESPKHEPEVDDEASQLLLFIESKRYSTTKKKPSHVEIAYEESAGENSGSQSKSIPKKKPDNPINNYAIIRDKIKEMRSGNDAPVDVEGPKTLYERGEITKEDQNFQIIVSLILSVQTRDQMTAVAMRKLTKAGLTIEGINNMATEDLLVHIGEVNFKNNKAKYIKNLALTLKEKMNNRLPNTLEDLLKLPGIGPKIALLYLQIAEEKVLGIAVDTHVHRISNRIGWVKTNTPEETRAQLESFIPKEDWPVINELLVGFGQTICIPINPKCTICKANDLCNYGKKAVILEGKLKEAEENSKGKKLKAVKSSPSQVAQDQTRKKSPPKRIKKNTDVQQPEPVNK